ncbi:hypothetical protein MQ089_08320 [Edwardsiella anguillarum]|uniref:hypothetical protein n=1 Tax=Edwardsiella anguillarum TaxID=1821960 RepID=UPI0024B767B9|nr:hypothetical protein [Edwardsiella anguillarum]WHP81814.1 hypothetical protein MQ090_08300 [Edwardsiella anguillarum]WHQ16395.1 hypothetical protein MQ085_10720 [Edwardsiella anguillarum]WHQ19317.1 hypothetical protein MQ085_08330 [Edwardsiella anguillarum]WHQ19928.1 hypothetical protein MQ089_10710 [Edwardsiella anguillarum]WHQ22861.1 hypothetical protein MQ089_08320 [Edwardsiella anguillarum]
MHQFNELAYRCTYFSLGLINEAYDKMTNELSETGSTSHVKNLQALNLQKMIHAVGLFSVFEAHLQEGLACRNGFKEAERILGQVGEHTLKEDFHNCYLAINALKHGDGASYKCLVSNISTLNFVVASPTTLTFEEGDVSGIFGLVRVDDSFIVNCLEIIEKVSNCIKMHRPDFIS